MVVDVSFWWRREWMGMDRLNYQFRRLELRERTSVGPEPGHRVGSV